MEQGPENTSSNISDKVATESIVGDALETVSTSTAALDENLQFEPSKQEETLSEEKPPREKEEKTDVLATEAIVAATSENVATNTFALDDNFQVEPSKEDVEMAQEEPPCKKKVKTDVLTTTAIVAETSDNILTNTTTLDETLQVEPSKEDVTPVQEKQSREKVHIQEVKTFRVDTKLLPAKQATAQSTVSNLLPIKQTIPLSRDDNLLPPKKATAQSTGSGAVDKLIAQSIKQMSVPNVEGVLIEGRNLIITKLPVAKTNAQPTLLLPKQPNKPINENSQKPFVAQSGIKHFKIPKQISCTPSVNKAAIVKSTQPSLLKTKQCSIPTLNQNTPKPLFAQSYSKPLPLPMQIASRPSDSKPKTMQKPFVPSEPLVQLPSATNKSILGPPVKLYPKIRKTVDTGIYAEEQFVEFINEALYDNEELAKQHVVALDNSDDDDEPEFEETPIEYLLERRKDNTIAIQTEEAAEDRINCGFINVTKSGPKKTFNLRCFYCDAEYPISFWSEFSEHVIYNHFDAEEAYVKEHEETKPLEEDDGLSIVTGMDVFHDLETASFMSDDTIHEKFKIENVENVTNATTDECIPNEIMPEDFVKNVVDSNDWESESDGEKEYMKVERYEPMADHNYSVDGFETVKPKPVEPIDEITFKNSPKKVVLDFLDHLKGLSSLWHERKKYPYSYDHELKVLLSLMKEKWQLNITKTQLRINLECIKSWYASMTTLKEEQSEKFQQHTYIAYYNACTEYLSQANTTKQDTFRCEMCNQACSSRIVLQVHKYRRHNVGQLPYSCNNCDRRFDYVYKLISHVKTHIKKKKVKRNVVDEILEFIKEEKNAAVDEISMPPPPLPPPPPPPPAPVQITYECYECNEKFTCGEEYKRHLDIHPKGNYRYCCDECGRRFTTAAILSGHKKHHKPPKYQCEFCPKKFYAIFKLRLHTDGHKGVTHYVCEYCGKQIRLQKDYVAHKRFKHMGWGLCKICNREYQNPFVFYRHMKTQHRPIFGTIEELTTHKKRKSKGKPLIRNRKYERVIDPVTKKPRLKCPKCDESFRRYETVYKHALEVHDFDVPRMQKRKPERQTKPKVYKKRVRGKKSSKQVSLDIEEAAAAVDALEEFTNIKVENDDPNGNEAAGPSGSSIGINVITDAENEKGVSFEKFIKDIASEQNNFPFQSSSNMLGDMYDQSTIAKEEAPFVAKVEEFDGSAFEFMLNANSPVVRFS